MIKRAFWGRRWYRLLPEVKRDVKLADMLDYKWNISANGKLF
jgi:hypothetical protein